MDGVLVDLYGHLSRSWETPLEDLVDHSSETVARYRTWVVQDPGPEEIFASLPPLHLQEMRSLMIELHARGWEVGILTSLGVSKEFDCGASVGAGKMRWLHEHYGDLISSGVMTTLHFVKSGPCKANFAAPGHILVDDTKHIVDSFAEAGGIGVHHKSWSHEASLAEILALTSRK